MASYEDLGNGFGVLRDDDGNIARYTNRPPQPEPQQQLPQSTSYQLYSVSNKPKPVDKRAMAVKQGKLLEEINDQMIVDNMRKKTQEGVQKDLQAVQSGKMDERNFDIKYGSKANAYKRGDFTLDSIDKNAIRSALNVSDGIDGTLIDSLTGGLFEMTGALEKKKYTNPLTGQTQELTKANARKLDLLLRAGIPSFVNQVGEVVSIDPKTMKRINWDEEETVWDMAAQATHALPGIVTSLAVGAIAKPVKAAQKVAPKLVDKALGKIGVTLGVADVGFIAGQYGYRNLRQSDTVFNNKLTSLTGETVNIIEEFEDTKTALAWVGSNAVDGMVGTVVAKTVLNPVLKKTGQAVKSSYTAAKENPKAYITGAIASNTILPPVVGQIASPFVAYGTAKLAKATVGPRGGKKVEEGIIREGLDKTKEFAGKADDVAAELLRTQKNESAVEGLARNTIGKIQTPLEKTKTKIYEAGRQYQGLGKGFVRGITDKLSPENKDLTTIVRRIDDELEYLHELYPILKDTNRVTEMVEQAKNLGFVPDSGTSKDFKVLLAMASQPGTTRFWEAVNKSSAMAMSNMNQFLRAHTAGVKNNILQLQKFVTTDGLRHAVVSNITSLMNENKRSLRALARGLDTALDGATVRLPFQKFGLSSTTTHKTAQRRKDGSLIEIELNTLGKQYSSLINHLGNGAQPLFLDKPVSSFKTGKAAAESAQSVHSIDYSMHNNSGVFHTYNTAEFSGKKGSEIRTMLQGMENDFYHPGQLAEMYINLKILGKGGTELKGNKDYHNTLAMLKYGISDAIKNPALAEDYFATLDEVIATTIGLERMAMTDLWRVLNTSNLSAKDLTDAFTRAAQKLDIDGYSELQQLSMFIKGSDSDSIKKSIDSVILDGVINKTMVADSDKTIYNCVQALDLINNLHFQTPDARVIKEAVQAAGSFFNKELFGLTDIGTRQALFSSGISSDYIKRAKVSWVSKTFKKIPALFSGTEAGKEERIVGMAVRALINKFDAKATTALEKYLTNNKHPTAKEVQINNIYREIKAEDIQIISSLKSFTDTVKNYPQAYSDNIDDAITEILKANGIDELPLSPLEKGAQNMTQANLDRLTSSALTAITRTLSDEAAKAGTKLDGDFVKSISRDDDFVNMMVDTVHDALMTQNNATNLVDLGETVMTMFERYEAFLKRNGKLGQNEYLPYDIEQIELAIQKKLKTNNEIQDILGE